MSLTGSVNSKNMRLAALVYDMVMAAVAMYAAVILVTVDDFGRFSLVGPFDGLGDYNLIFGAVLPFVASACASLLTLGTYRTSWRHASTTDLTNIFKVVTLAVLIYMPVCFVVNRLYFIPRTSLVLAWMVLLLLMGGADRLPAVSRPGTGMPLRTGERRPQDLADSCVGVRSVFAADVGSVSINSASGGGFFVERGGGGGSVA